ncbi:MAG: hypothetical protein ABIQ16_09130, partial [Polyangiaceae bacterium]
GIEDLHEGHRPGGGGDGNTAGAGNDAGMNSTAGMNNTAGKNNTAGSTARGGASGSGNPTAGSGNEPGGEGGEGGALNPGNSTVHGHVIDFWGHSVPNIPVQLGDTLGSTDEKGEFVFDDVADQYDVSLVFDHPDADQSDAWVYQDLTRRDPTLQIYTGGARRSGSVEITFSPTPTLAAGQTIWVAMAGLDGSNVYDDLSESGLSPYAYWYGPSTTQQTAHGLYWQQDANGLPTGYLAYDSALLALAGTGTSKSSLDLTKKTIDSGNIQGTVTSTGSDRANQVFLRFNSNARITLVDDNGPNTFTYLVPSIAGSSLTVAASEGRDYEGWAVAHEDGLAASAKPALKIPALVSLLTPAGAASGITSTSKFAFQSPTGNGGPFVVQFYSQPEDKTYQTIYVVTAKKQITLPSIIGGGFTLYPGSGYIWSVATHGQFDSVDAMASKDGFLDEFSRDEVAADGPRTNSGFFTDSVPRGFTTAP